MLSLETILRLDRLYGQQNTYKPHAELQAQLSHKTAVLVVGAACQGKNTLMSAVVHQDKRFHTIGTITSRPPRDSDQGLPYTYYENSDEGLKPILNDIDAGEVVQYAINPYSRFLYASKLSDYPGQYNIGDYFSSAVAPFRTLGFRSAPAVSIVSPVADWLTRFDERFPVGHSDRQARRDEAIESLVWSLAQTDNHLWVLNTTDDTEHTARQLILAITSTANVPDTDARALAEASLAAAMELVV